MQSSTATATIAPSNTRSPYSFLKLSSSSSSSSTASSSTALPLKPSFPTPLFRPSLSRRVSLLLGIATSTPTSLPLPPSRNASSASIPLQGAVTPPSNLPEEADELAGKRRQRRKDELRHVEKVVVFPGWSVVRSRKGDPTKSDIHVYTSGFCTSLRPVEKATRTQKVFTKMARGFAALPKLPASDLLSGSADPTIVASDDAPPVPDLPAQFCSNGAPIAAAVAAQSIAEHHAISSSTKRSKHSRKLSLPAVFGFHSKGQSSESVLVQEPESMNTSQENLEADAASGSRHPHLHAIASKLLSGYTLQELRRLHHNLDARLQPFWSSTLPHRALKMKFGPADDPDIIWASREVSCDSCGLFKSRIQIPIEDLPSYHETSDYSGKIRVEVELLPVVSKKQRARSMQEQSMSRDVSPQRTFSVSSAIGSRSTSPVIPPMELTGSPLLPGLVFDHIPRSISPEPESFLNESSQGAFESLHEIVTLGERRHEESRQRMSISSAGTSHEYSESQTEDSCSTAGRSTSSRSDSATSFTTSGLGARDSAVIPMTRDKGVRVLSDVDDTIKATGITTGLRNVFKNVFVKHVEDLVLDDMGDWYRGMEKKGARGFHYCSNGPFELFNVTEQFFNVARLPAGSLRLKYYGGKTLFQSLWQPAAVRKRAGVIDVLNEFPDTKFILIGDSGEQDMELYTAVAHERPEQVAAIFIRDVSTPEGITPPYETKIERSSDHVDSTNAKSRPNPRRAFSDPSTPSTTEFNHSLHAPEGPSISVDSVSPNGHVSMNDVSRIEKVADAKMQNYKKLNVFKARVEKARKLVPPGVIFKLFKYRIEGGHCHGRAEGLKDIEVLATTDIRVRTTISDIFAHLMPPTLSTSDDLRAYSIFKNEIRSEFSVRCLRLLRRPSGVGNCLSMFVRSGDPFKRRAAEGASGIAANIGKKPFKMAGILKRGGRRSPRRASLLFVYIVIGFIAAYIIINAFLFPVYLHKPSHYKALEELAQSSSRPGRANPRNLKVFIAANIINMELVEGAWGNSVIELIDLLGPDNVFLSIYENDIGGRMSQVLKELGAKLSCNTSINTGDQLDTSQMHHSLELESGEHVLSRTEYLAFIRNKALEPLDRQEDFQMPTFDKLFFLNDVYFSPIEAVNLLLSTNQDSNGEAQYEAACAVDFVTLFNLYDTFATRDSEGRGTGYSAGILPFPWFATGASRDDVLAGSDAVRVKSCWGGMTAFRATYFQKAKSSQSDRNKILNPEPIRFRGTDELFWDSSECCLIHADVSARYLELDPRHVDSGIFMNPYVRTAYSITTWSWLKFFVRFEHGFSIIQYWLTALSGHFPEVNERAFEKVDTLAHRRIWRWSEKSSGSLVNQGEYKNEVVVVTPGGFCGQRNTFYILPDWKEMNRKGLNPYGKLIAPRSSKSR